MNLPNLDHFFKWADIGFFVAGSICCFIGIWRQCHRPHAPKQLAEGALQPLVFAVLLFGMSDVVKKLALPREFLTNVDIFGIGFQSLLFLVFILVWLVTVLKNRTN